MLPPGERRCVRRRDRHTDRRTDARLLQDVTVPWQYRLNLGIHSIRLRSLREFKQHFSGPWSIHSPKIDINPPARFRATSLRSRQRGKGGGQNVTPATLWARINTPVLVAAVGGVPAQRHCTAGVHKYCSSDKKYPHDHVQQFPHTVIHSHNRP